MLKTRIRRWKLDKKLKLPDMRTAIQLISENGYDGQGPEPRFRIRDRVVPYSEALRYFRRKGILDPLNWLRSLPSDGFVPSSDVKLVTVQSEAGSLCTTDEDDHSATGPWLQALPQGIRHVPMADTTQLTLDPGDAEVLLPMHISLTMQPFLSSGAEQVVHRVNSYCDKYLSSSRSLEHTEPAVHHLTTHAVFAQRMQDGTASLLRNERASAFNDFDSAFALVRDLLTDHHPMSIALILSVICQLDGQSLGALVFHLFRHAEEMATVELGASDPLTTLLRAFTNVEGGATDLALLAVRRAADHLGEFGGVSDWKALYLRERLCDCLYYAPSYDHERATRRRALLRDQEAVYGLCTCNVIWTLTNVADDCLQLGRCEEAKMYFGQALKRSQALSGYGRAKSRFAALEGLARCGMADARWMHTYQGNGADETLAGLSKANEALRLLKEAQAGAKVWFSPSSRRAVRVQTSIHEAEAFIDSLSI